MRKVRRRSRFAPADADADADADAFARVDRNTDAGCDRCMQVSLRELMKGRTVMTIAHRLSTMKVRLWLWLWLCVCTSHVALQGCDLVAVMEGGKVRSLFHGGGDYDAHHVFAAAGGRSWRVQPLVRRQQQQVPLLTAMLDAGLFVSHCAFVSASAPWSSGSCTCDMSNPAL